MAEIQKTNICCLDLTQDCVDYLKGLGLNVHDGSLGSVFHIDWSKAHSRHGNVFIDVDYPDNLHEYHVFVVDTTNVKRREYKFEEHKTSEIDHIDKKCLVVSQPITVLDLRPFGTFRLEKRFQSLSSHRRIEVVFVGPYQEVEYTSSRIAYYEPEHVGTFNNYSAWGLLNSSGCTGERTQFADTWISRCLFGGRRNDLHYHQIFRLPTRWEGEQRVPDERYFSILDNEDGESVSYIFAPDKDFLRIVLPDVKDKAGLLKDLFENILFNVCSDYFPDIEAKRWINKDVYLLPEERKIQERIEAKREEYEKEIAKLEEKAVEIRDKNHPLKNLLTETGSTLVIAVKTFLEWLGYENVTDKDDTLNEGDLKEEDLCFEYEGNHILMEVKGINGTSTDAECSQIDKIVSRRMRELKTTYVHGIYVVNNQRNVEPLKRQTPPFNETQIKDAIDQSRTLVYTAQLFALHSDIENGYTTKEQARKDLLQPGLANFHSHLDSVGTPYEYYQGDTVLCIDLHSKVSIGDKLYYKDTLHRLVGLNVISLQKEKHSFESVSEGKTGVKVDVKVPRNREIFKLMDEFVATTV